MWDLRALRSPLMRAQKPRSQAVREMRGFELSSRYVVKPRKIPDSMTTSGEVNRATQKSIKPLLYPMPPYKLVINPSRNNWLNSMIARLNSLVEIWIEQFDKNLLITLTKPPIWMLCLSLG